MKYPYLNWLLESMNYMEYPEDTINFVTDTYKQICHNTRAETLFHNALNLYEKQLCPAWVWALNSAEKAVAQINAHKFVGKFIMSLCVTRSVKTFYEQKGMPDGCFDGFLKDIKIKWAECVEVDKINGVAVAEWFHRFVDGTRHTFGRLQFEPVFNLEPCEIGGRKVREGDLVINIHIPSGSKLFKQDCIDSFLKAAEYYAPLFEGGEVVFHCHSWLLYPEHKNFLPENSAILMFADFFKCILSEASDGNDLWRIFGTRNTRDYKNLPEKTSLQRAYKQRLIDGKEVGIGVGFFIVKNNKFIK